MRISKNTLRIGHEAGYYNPVDAFRFRAEILPEKYFDEDAADKAKEIKKYERCARLAARALINNGLQH